MINHNTQNWLSLFAEKYTRHILSKLASGFIAMTVYTSALVFAFHHYEIEYEGTTAVHSIMGMVLGFFLVFRSNGAYDRWWEGRKTWGALVNNSRNLSFKIAAMVPKDHKHYSALTECIAAYPKTLKEHLRSGVPQEDADKLKTSLDIEMLDHKPNTIAKKIVSMVNELKKEDVIDAEQYRVLDNQVMSLTDITGVCERIRNTPIPYSYSIFTKKFIVIYMVTLPFAFMPHFGYWTILIQGLLFYVLMSIELLAEEIEDPFGADINDLPTDSLSEKIEANIREILK